MNQSVNPEYNEAFNTTVGLYQEIKHSGGLNSVMGNGPSLSDFLADIEIAAIRSLSDEQLIFFNHFYKEQRIVPPETGLSSSLKYFEQLDMGTRNALGAKLLENGIYPTTKYFTPSAIG